jgi:hypothetical protein
LTVFASAALATPEELPLPAEELEALRHRLVDALPSLTLEGIASYITSGRARRIVVACGAGISCAAEILDFRTPGTGLYASLQRYGLPYPEAIFDINYFLSIRRASSTSPLRCSRAGFGPLSRTTF